jgi:hypothetical protein
MLLPLQDQKGTKMQKYQIQKPENMMLTLMNRLQPKLPFFLPEVLPTQLQKPHGVTAFKSLRHTCLGFRQGIMKKRHRILTASCEKKNNH